jgi:hypothetical protein
MLRKVAQDFSLTATSKATCLNLQHEQMSIMHHFWLPYPPPWKIIQHSPWADWIPTPNKTEKHKQQIAI